MEVKSEEIKQELPILCIKNENEEPCSSDECLSVPPKTRQLSNDFKIDINTSKDSFNFTAVNPWGQVIEPELPKNLDENLNRNQNEENSDSTSTKKLYKCPQCSYKCNSQTSLKAHTSASRHNEEGPIKCTQCDFTTTKTNYLTQHMTFKHTPEDFKWLKCEHCSFKAKFQRYLRYHVLRRHTSEDSIKWMHCDHCSYKARVKDDIYRHMRVVHNILSQFKCEFCRKNFRRSWNLDVHIASRHAKGHDEKWFECEHCSNKKFKLRSSLVRHLRLNHSQVD